MDNLVSGAINPNQYGLITRERAEKFDLLEQLILNQREAIILCGAEGIGKTTLLNVFKKQRENISIICLLQGVKTSSFEQIQTQLVSTIQQYNPELANHDLQSALSFCEQQQQKAVLMIDDAVELVAGLTTTLTEYALQNPVLRIVFAFTREELYLKNSTDSVLDDCYFMEIPALTKPQITVFLQDSSVFSNLDEAQTISDSSLTELYHLTDGVPGKIVACLPLLANLERKRHFYLWLKRAVLICAVTTVIAVIFVYNNYLPIPPLSLAVKPVKPMIKQNVAAIAQQKKLVNFQQISNVSKATKPQLNNQTVLPDADEQWVLQQAAEKYTLQLMAFSKRQSLLNVVKKYQSLQAELRIVLITSNHRERYVLLYGSFVDTKAANNAVSSLPVEFEDAWPKQFSVLQAEIKNRTFPH